MKTQPSSFVMRLNYLTAQRILNLTFGLSKKTHTHTKKKSKRAINIIEINCPYVMMNDSNKGRVSLLVVRRKEKEKKYAPLIDDIKTTWNDNATLHVIVVSSFGAIP